MGTDCLPTRFSMLRSHGHHAVGFGRARTSQPFRMALKPETGSHDPEDGDPGALYIGDVGYVTWEELNVCDGPGQNFGWPIYEGHYLEPGYAPVLTENPSAPTHWDPIAELITSAIRICWCKTPPTSLTGGTPATVVGFLGMNFLRMAISTLMISSWEAEFSAFLIQLPPLRSTPPSCTGHLRLGRTKPGFRKDFPVVGGKSYVASVKAVTPSWDSISGTSTRPSWCFNSSPLTGLWLGMLRTM